MQKELPVGNRVVYNKEYQKDCIRRKRRLNEIRHKSHSIYYNLQEGKMVKSINEGNKRFRLLQKSSIARIESKNEEI